VQGSHERWYVSRPSLASGPLIDQPPTPLQACIDFIETTTSYTLKESRSTSRYGGSASTTTVVFFGGTPSYGRMIRLQTSSRGNNLVRWEEELPEAGQFNVEAALRRHVAR
jgi:hypothetical protein